MSLNNLMTQREENVTESFVASYTSYYGRMANGTETIPDQNQTWTNKWNTFCSHETDQVCADIPLNKCSTCSQFSFWLFFTLIFLLASWILFVNSFVIVYVINGKRGRRTSLEYLKGSLAVTDLLTGVMLVCGTLPNIVWTTKLTSREVYFKTRKAADTPVAVIAASCFMLLLTSTLYHLLLMSYNRFAAIFWPSPQTKPKNLGKKLLVLWIFAILAASYPAWFPGSFHFYYIYYTFIYLPNISIRSRYQLYQAFGLFTIMAVPYLIMTSFTIATAILIRRANRNAREQLSESIRVRNQIIQREKAAYKTLAIMELGFTLTLLPSLIVLALAYTKNGHPIAFLFMTYCALCNRSVESVIYRVQTTAGTKLCD
ncbi:unnamed protein product [Clavelina lepadiformis]|uniref:G-protein coupled receptors family 1 profile domain-containing protein n=1 Tax=Clavelina lepadiformis TaxID=159417 RepID=A0ABP0GQS8_CLALP